MVLVGTEPFRRLGKLRDYESAFNSNPVHFDHYAIQLQLILTNNSSNQK